MQSLKQSAEGLRRIETLIRYGTIEEIDHSKALARVKTGEVLTDWLPWLALRAGTTTIWTPPTKGEQVAVLAPSGELHTGVILMGLYSNPSPPPSNNPATHVVKFQDGAIFTYDSETHALTVDKVANVTINASDKITLNTPLVECTNDVHIKNLSTADGDHISAGISGKGHTHGQNAGDHFGGGASTTPPR